MSKIRAMSNVIESSNPNGPLATRAEVIASNDPTAPDLQAPPPPVAPPAAISVGALLREGRERQGLSPADIAGKLRMGLKQVTALENSDYAVLPTGTFLRGFVRNYAKAVALNANDVLALLEKTHSGSAAVKASPVVVPSQQNIKVPAPGGDLSTPSGRALVFGIVFLLLLAAVWYWWEYVLPHRNEGGRANTTGATQSIAVPQPALPAVSRAPAASVPADATSAGVDVATQVQAPERNVTTAISAAPAVTNASQTVAPTLPSVATGAAEAESARSQAAVPRAGGGALGFTFSGDSWVEVVDGNGKTVLSRRFSAGDAEEISGRSPFSVVIGNAKSTRMAFNGREFDLAPHTRGAVARVTVN